MSARREYEVTFESEDGDQLVQIVEADSPDHAVKIMRAEVRAMFGDELMFLSCEPVDIHPALRMRRTGR